MGVLFYLWICCLTDVTISAGPETLAKQSPLLSVKKSRNCIFWASM